MEGYIRLYRKIKENKYWLEPRKFSKAEAWIDLLLRAGFKDKELVLGDLVLSLKAGQFVTSQIKLAEAWGWNRETVNKLLKRLKIDKQIDYKTSNKFTTITICNWDRYQNQNKGKPATGPTAKPTTAQHQDSIRTGTINNVKNDNKKEKKLFFDFVYLTDDEHKKLLEKFGEQGTQDRIDKLNNYIGSKGNKYKSHYHTILTWANRDKEKPLVVALSQKTAARASPSLDLDKLLSEKLGRIATEDMIKAVLREIPQDIWWKVDNFLKKRYSGGGSGFAEAEREVIAEARENQEKFKKLTQGIGNGK